MKNENMDELIMKLTDLEISARVMAAGLESLCQKEGSWKVSASRLPQQNFY